MFDNYGNSYQLKVSLTGIHFGLVMTRCTGLAMSKIAETLFFYEQINTSLQANFNRFIGIHYSCNATQ